MLKFCFLKVDDGKVDGERLRITGSSAGGYTTLASLAFRETFKAGASLCGVSVWNNILYCGFFRLLILHLLLELPIENFLECCIRKLISYAEKVGCILSLAAGSNDAFLVRSPINHVDKFSCPIILFQELEDKVVHPEQACKIYSALKQKGLPVALVEYKGELHGFRKVLSVVVVHAAFATLNCSDHMAKKLIEDNYFTLFLSHSSMKFEHRINFDSSPCHLNLALKGNNSTDKVLLAKNIKFTLELQMLFFARTVGHFEVADDNKPIPIENFD
ncbi:Peptidase S9, prolyl oligopeptidase, catalytic domain [Dillenia turbinata]|uniref:Peptidase S9, prolyl oligopeptidase, catalytic domain n=1 Tax=Dillenia turbinata TaxID=194707 RepID=A0AAN8UVZ8_9MAGN